MLGIENDAEALAVATEVIDWDALECELTGIAQALVARQGTKVRPAVAGRLSGKDAKGDSELGSAEADEDLPRVWCHFSAIPRATDGTGQRTQIVIDDILPEIDRLMFIKLPQWGAGWSQGAYRSGKNIVAVAMNAGLIDRDVWQDVEFEGIDETAYERYYDIRRKREHLPPVDRSQGDGR